ncbi:MAG: NADH-quinone oxidoreductase subunit C [Crenarchaeota archaeon]|nr:NADH-quinone oxidoreductase subunit C [Thermoproteota archaeon]
MRDPSEILAKYGAEEGLIKPSTRVYQVDASRIRELVQELVREYGENRVFVSTIVGIDRPQDGKIEVDIFIEVLGFKPAYCIKVLVPRDDPRMPSIVDILPSALVGELEAHDVLGVVFEGNVYLRRPVFVPEEIASKGAYPLRKDFKV